MTKREREETTPAAVVAVNEYVMVPVRENVVVILFNTVCAVVPSVMVPALDDPVTAPKRIRSDVPAGIAEVMRAVTCFALPDVVRTVYVVVASLSGLGAMPALTTVLIRNP